MKSNYQIGIVTLANDLHGVAIQKTLQKYKDVNCHIIESDCICNSTNINWSSTSRVYENSFIRSRENEKINIKNLDIIWWRRFNYKQKIDNEITDEVVTSLINNECMESMLGVIINEFSGTWINDPFATRRAENKIIQMKAAQEIGFKIPKTLVSQDPYEIRQFCKSLNNEVVIKPVKGTPLQAVFTRKITEEHLKSDYSLKLAPAMYQEFIPGNKHIRIHCFGNSVYAVLIESDLLDWRENLEIPFKIIDLDENMKRLSLSIVNSLGLKMGILDIKLVDNSTPIWLEINPQGQFLFVEGLSGLDLSSFFSQFLYVEAKSSRNSKELL